LSQLEQKDKAMHIKKIILASCCIQTLCAGLKVPDDIHPAKPVRNNIMSSVAKTPIALAKSPVTSAIDLRAPTLDTFTPLLSNAKPTITSSVSKKQDLAKKIEPIEPVQIPKIELPEPSAQIAHQTPLLQTIPHPAAQPSIMTSTAQEEVTPAQQEKPEPGVLYQTQNFVQDDAPVLAFNFEEASLQNLLSYMESVHNIKFISEDIIPTAKDIKGIAGHKITFRTNRTLTRKESWDLCITFLHIAGFDVLPMMEPGFYRLVPLTKANNEPIPTYIGVDHNVLPDNDMIVRYVYFVRNVDPIKIQPMLKTMSSTGKIDVYAELKALIFSDRASSIKSLMQIVIELDRSALPEVLSVLKLKRANAKDVIDLYTSLKPATGAQPQKVWAPSKKEAAMDYFPADVTMVHDARTNSLILLGSAKDVARIEEFITKHVDIALDRNAPPVFTYRLQYTNAKDITDTLTKIISYGSGTDAGKYGGVRDGIKYFQKMTIIPDTWTNTLVINSTPEDFEALKPLIEQLDTPQKQIGIEVLFVAVKDVDVKTLGAQISGPNGQGSLVSGASPYGPTFLSNASAQTSGVTGSNIVVTRSATAGVGDDFSIKSSLASLLGNSLVNEVGSVLVTFGQPIWAIFKILKSITSTHVITNPFVVVSNNCTVELTSGEEQRQPSGTVISSSSVKATGLVPIQALFKVSITPQINRDNIINMNIDVQNQQFVAGLNNSVTTGNPRDLKHIATQASVANGETLVLGGIMSENYAASGVGVPFLQNIPILGWFFKSKTRNITRDHFLIFICPRILEPVDQHAHVNKYTDYKMHEMQSSIDLIDDADWFTNSKDPVQKAFFGDKESSRTLQEFRTGKQFATREAIDGRINHKKPAARQKKLDKIKDKKKSQKDKILKTRTKPTEAVADSSSKNTISKGVAHAV
jgi:general secretion pathway protein D